MRDLNLVTYYFSVSQANESTRYNSMNHEVTLASLQSLGFNVADIEGSYNGIRESSLAIRTFKNDDSMILNICAANNQESYLRVDENGVAELVFLSGESKIIGQWRQAPEHEALRQDVWTKLPNGEYRIVKPFKVRS